MIELNRLQDNWFCEGLEQALNGLLAGSSLSVCMAVSPDNLSQICRLAREGSDADASLPPMSLPGRIAHLQRTVILEADSAEEVADQLLTNPGIGPGTEVGKMAVNSRLHLAQILHSAHLFHQAYQVVKTIDTSELNRAGAIQLWHLAMAVGPVELCMRLSKEFPIFRSDAYCLDHARANVLLNQPEVAMNCCREYRRVLGETVDVLLMEQWVYEKMGQMDQMLSILKRLEELEPEPSVELFIAVARAIAIRDSAGGVGESLRFFEKALHGIEIKTQWHYLFDYAVTCLKRGDREKAWSLARQGQGMGGQGNPCEVLASVAQGWTDGSVCLTDLVGRCLGIGRQNKQFGTYHKVWLHGVACHVLIQEGSAERACSVLRELLETPEASNYLIPPEALEQLRKLATIRNASPSELLLAIAEAAYPRDGNNCFRRMLLTDPLCTLPLQDFGS